MNIQSAKKPVAIVGLVIVAVLVGHSVFNRTQDGGAEFNKTADDIKQGLCELDPKTEGCPK